jgi:hypothetical protein
MRIVVALAVLVPSALVVFFSATVLRPRIPAIATDTLAAVGGAGLGFGALFFQEGVSSPAWLIAPVLVGTLMVIHVRVLYHGDGPLRT